MIDLTKHMSPALAARLERVLKFAMTGGIGFVVDIGVLTLLTNDHFFIDMNAYVARIFAILVAMTTTWLINRRFTFKVHGKVTDRRELVAEGGRYGLVAVSAAIVNYGVYALTLYSLPDQLWGTDDFQPPLAAIVGSGVAMFFSYYGYSRFALRHADPLPGATPSA